MLNKILIKQLPSNSTLGFFYFYGFFKITPLTVRSLCCSAEQLSKPWINFDALQAAFHFLVLLTPPKVVHRADLCTSLSPSCHSCHDRAPGCPAAPEPLLPRVGPVGFPTAHQVVRVGLGTGGHLWESCVASTTKDMAFRALLHSHRSPVALLVLPGSCAGGAGREWEAGVRTWGDVPLLQTPPVLGGQTGSCSMEQLSWSRPCAQPSLHSECHKNSECT